MNMDIAKKLGPTKVKKYWKHTSQVQIKLDWLYNQISAIAMFVRYL